ncbi:Tetratricopeptide repeat-domain-containing protein [Jimgerdemannia flammicorona]|uniref:Tetratricopeptide repeat-domain-containing protein n=1 Tax=Jimgerdemannia flammicorona TaxID=994334 RepID=A0A433DKG0_9FUNG|nr:Tetratricopeptide repeat-domain-containing protein [Jimgerdemannia flammicorona]
MENAADVDPYIPATGGDIIATTRNHVPSTWATVIDVDKMTNEQALQLLLGSQPLSDDFDTIHAQQIVREVDCFPLAINLARSYIERTKITFESYLDDMFAVHRMVQTVVRDSMESSEHLQCLEAIIAALSKEMVSAEYHIPQVRISNEVHLPQSAQNIDVVLDREWFLSGHRRARTDGCIAKLGTEHPITATSLSLLAFVYHRQATSLNNLAALYNSQGKYDKAEPLYERALIIREKVLGSEHPDTAQYLNNLAIFYRGQGDYDKARLLCERALSIREKVLGSEHPHTAQSRRNLASCHRTA